MSKIELVEEYDAVFSSEDGRMIDCTVCVDGGSPMRYTAHADDVYAPGRALFAVLMLQPDKIAPYVAPKPPESK